MTAPSDPTALTWMAAVLAWALAVPLYRVSRYVAVVPHEGGHAAVAKLLFQAVQSIRLGKGGSGATKFDDKLPWLYDVFITLAGYLGPSIFGLMAAWLLARGQTDAVLWGSLAFLVLMLIPLRGPLGWIVVPTLMVAIFLVATRVDGSQRDLLAHVWVWFLLISGVEATLVHLTAKGYRDQGADTAVMRRLTLLPGGLWALVLLVGTVAALVYGGGMLLRLTGT